MSRVLAASIIASSALISQLSLAEEDYRFEISASLQDGSLEAVDIDSTIAKAEFFFETINGDDLYPIAESAYVAKVDSFSVIHQTTEISNILGSNESTLTGLEYRKVTESDKTWRFSFNQQEAKSSNVTAEFKGFGVAFGSYISESSSFEVSYLKNLYDGSDSNIEDTHAIGISFRSVKELEESGFFAFDLSFQSQKQATTTVTTARLKPEYYLNRNLGIFIDFSSQRSSVLHATNIGAGANWFITPAVKLTASYLDSSPQPTGEESLDGESLNLALSFRL